MSPFDALDAVLAQVVPTKRLSEYGMSHNDTDHYAARVIETQQRLLVNCYVPLSNADTSRVYGQLI